MAAGFTTATRFNFNAPARNKKFGCVPLISGSETTTGFEARNYLRTLVASSQGQVIVIEMDRDRHGRGVAEVLLESPSGEQSVQEEMLKAGMAYHYKQYSGNCHNRDVFDAAEQGQSQKSGV